MLRMKKGCRVPEPAALDEGYELQEWRVIANVHADRILPLMQKYLQKYGKNGLFYFILELPTPKNDEPADENGRVERLHNDVYRLGGLEESFALNMLAEDGALLVYDGLSAFGFGVMGQRCEAFCERYNLVNFFSDDPGQFVEMLDDFGLQRQEKLVTAWDYFTDDNPGECVKVEIAGRSVYDLPKKYAKYGMRFVERREK